MDAQVLKQTIETYESQVCFWFCPGLAHFGRTGKNQWFLPVFTVLGKTILDSKSGKNREKCHKFGCLQDILQ